DRDAGEMLAELAAKRRLALDHPLGLVRERPPLRARAAGERRRLRLLQLEDHVLALPLDEDRVAADAEAPETGDPRGDVDRPEVVLRLRAIAERGRGALEGVDDARPLGVGD